MVPLKRLIKVKNKAIIKKRIRRVARREPPLLKENKRQKSTQIKLHYELKTGNKRHKQE